MTEKMNMTECESGMRLRWNLKLKGGGVGGVRTAFTDQSTQSRHTSRGNHLTLAIVRRRTVTSVAFVASLCSNRRLVIVFTALSGFKSLPPKHSFLPFPFASWSWLAGSNASRSRPLGRPLPRSSRRWARSCEPRCCVSLCRQDAAVLSAPLWVFPLTAVHNSCQLMFVCFFAAVVSLPVELSALLSRLFSGSAERIQRRSEKCLDRIINGLPGDTQLWHGVWKPPCYSPLSQTASLCGVCRVFL